MLKRTLIASSDALLAWRQREALSSAKSPTKRAWTIFRGRLALLFFLPIQAYASNPGPITDLHGAGSTPYHIDVAWTAPGDDGYVGVLSSYEVRYSSTPAFLGDFSTGILFGWQPTPEDEGDGMIPGWPGDEEVIGITDLEPGTDYFVGVRAFDATGNFSTSFAGPIRTKAIHFAASSDTIGGAPGLQIVTQEFVATVSLCGDSAGAIDSLAHMGREHVTGVYCVRPHGAVLPAGGRILASYESAVVLAKSMGLDSLRLYGRSEVPFVALLEDAPVVLPAGYFKQLDNQLPDFGKNRIEAFIDSLPSTLVVAGLAPRVILASTPTVRGLPELVLVSRDKLLTLGEAAADSPGLSSALAAASSAGLAPFGRLYRIFPEEQFFLTAGTATMRIDRSAPEGGFLANGVSLRRLGVASTSFVELPGQTEELLAGALEVSISSTMLLGAFGPKE